MAKATLLSLSADGAERIICVKLDDGCLSAGAERHAAVEGGVDSVFEVSLEAGLYCCCSTTVF